MTTKTNRQEAIETLRGQFGIKPGDTLYTNLIHVSASGMYRVLDVYKIVDNTLLRLSWSAAAACGLKYDMKHEGVGMRGCGMDMGFWLVYELSSVLFPDGFACIGAHPDGRLGPNLTCPSNDHTNGDRSYRKHKTRGPESVCDQCDGLGTTSRQTFGTAETISETCRTCNGSGVLSPKHWHRNGGYALRQKWL